MQQQQFLVSRATRVFIKPTSVHVMIDVLRKDMLCLSHEHTRAVQQLFVRTSVNGSLLGAFVTGMVAEGKGPGCLSSRAPKPLKAPKSAYTGPWYRLC